MQSRRALWWRVVQIIIAVLILAAVGWHFYKILRQPNLRSAEIRIDWAWIVASGALYCIGLIFWGGFWFRLVRQYGDPLSILGAARAYATSHLGKYVPGKVVAVIARVSLARADSARAGVSVLTAVYETLTTMAAGAMIAAILLPLLRAGDSALGWKALGLLAIAGVPILPGVFNRLGKRAAKPFLPADSPPLPPMRVTTLLGGFLQTSVGWLFLGGSLFAMMHALPDAAFAMTGRSLLLCIAYMAISYVAGFLALPTPGGLGVRETILQQLLLAELAHLASADAAAIAVLAVLLLRLLWTLCEIILVVVTFTGYRICNSKRPVGALPADTDQKATA
jgi:uncharacterized membrane protein YbhN (UPF0104 family)